ncbi:hypothetical protein C8F04DRAFT_445735 [Mycena alexandri]|uniref:Uncharacterized protein n=1 Tax=Mycena alexandri TaxID=1745969 RepID=A0AAD6THC3_9AGAR|nr:hypothetical protein C8F04DRAFT_445735 [Mycena alexandri]
MPSLNWSTALQRTIMKAHLPGSESSNPRRSKHPSGAIWKCLLALSISADLKCGADGQDDNTTRFIRIEDFGLSGVLFYSAPPRRASIPTDSAMEAEIDALIERNAVQVLYFPNLACTSFVIGQVMKSHLLSDPTVCPKPHITGSGFSLHSRAFETLGLALACGTLVPIRDLSGDLKPTPQCAERVTQDRRHATHAARLLLAVRYRNIMRSRASGSPSVPEETSPGKVAVDASRVDVEEHQYHDAPQTPPTHSPPTFRSNAAIPSLDCRNKLPSLHTRLLLANAPSKLHPSADPKDFVDSDHSFAEDEEYFDAPESPYCSLLPPRSIRSFDGGSKLHLLPALRNNRHANTLSTLAASVDPRDSEKKHGLGLGFELAEEKENNVFM